MKKIFRIFIALISVAAVAMLLTTFVRDPGSEDAEPYIAVPTQVDLVDTPVPQALPPTIEAVPIAEDSLSEDEAESETTHGSETFVLPDYGFSTTPILSHDSFINNDGVFPYNPDSLEFYYVLGLPASFDSDNRPILNFSGDYSIVTPTWDDNNEHILFTVNERPFGGSAWFSFYVVFDIGGQTITRGGSITIINDSIRLVWNHDGAIDSFYESFCEIEHFVFEDNRNLTYKHLLTIEQGERVADRLASNHLHMDDWPVFVPAPGTSTASDAVTIRPISSVEIHRDGMSRGMWAISITGWAVGEIVVTLDGQTYALPVSFEPPEIGFSRNSTFTGLNDIISTFTFDPESGNNTFYYILPTELNTRGLHRDNIEVLTRDGVDPDFITAAWARNNRSVRFTVNEMPQAYASIAFGLTNNALGQIYGNIYHSSTWLDVIEGLDS